MKKEIMLPLLALGFVVTAGTVRAAENTVLFKIHDVVPIKNSDGLVTSCELGATFYNRSGTEISNATVNLLWHDEVVADTIEQEQRKERENKRLKRTTNSRYKTADLSSKDIMLTLKLPTMKPQQQVSLKSKVTTDRCFLLLNDVEVNVSNCRTGASTGSSGESCQNMFQHVTTSNPEYYSEFRAVSADEIIDAENAQIEKQKNDVQSLYNESLNEINQITANFAYTPGYNE